MPRTVDYGDRDVALANEILRSVVGSGVHGVAIEGTDDHDEMGVFVEPPEYVLGATRRMDHHVWRSQPEGVRSGPGDTDLVVYSLRKYLRLALKGNPTVLLPLFAPESDLQVTSPLGHELRALRDALLSRRAVHRFLGYMRSQHERMLGRRAGTPTRPELIERYGYDVKYASHALRLALQGHELATTGGLTLPMPEEQRQEVLAVKSGGVAREAVTDRVMAVVEEVRRVLDEGRTPLPVRPDLDAVDGWSCRAHRVHWGWAA